MAPQTKKKTSATSRSNKRSTKRSSKSTSKSTSNMTTMSIAVPISMKKQIVSRVKAGGYGNISEYVRELVRHDPDTRHKYIEERLLEGVRSGPEFEATGEFWEKLRRISKFAAAESKKAT